MSKCGRVRSRWPAGCHPLLGKPLLQMWTQDVPSAPIAECLGMSLFQSALQEERHNVTECIHLKYSEYCSNLIKDVTCHMCCRPVIFALSLQLRFIATWNNPQIRVTSPRFPLCGNIFTFLGIIHAWCDVFILTNLLLSCNKLSLRLKLQRNERNREISIPHHTVLSSVLSKSSLTARLREDILSHWTGDHRWNGLVLGLHF